MLRAGSEVERADVTTLFADPQAEYTQALLEAVPELSDIDVTDGGAPSRRLRSFPP